MLRLNSLFKKVAGAALAVGSAAVVSVMTVATANAQSAIDPTAVVAGITAQEGTITTIGSAILVLVVGIVAYRWVRRIIK
jgi:hypothetical protein